MNIINEGLSPGLRTAQPLEQSWRAFPDSVVPLTEATPYALLCPSLCPSTGEVPAHFVCNWSRADLTAEGWPACGS